MPLHDCYCRLCVCVRVCESVCVFSSHKKALTMEDAPSHKTLFVCDYLCVCGEHIIGYIIPRQHFKCPPPQKKKKRKKEEMKSSFDKTRNGRCFCLIANETSVAHLKSEGFKENKEGNKVSNTQHHLVSLRKKGQKLRNDIWLPLSSHQSSIWVFSLMSPLSSPLLSPALTSQFNKFAAAPGDKESRSGRAS